MSKGDDRVVTRDIVTRSTGGLTDGDVLIRVNYSSLNYKDALGATGHPGVAKTKSLVPGIDAAGTVVESRVDQFSIGDEVMVFHGEFGTKVDGGYSEFIRVPAEWVYHVPNTMTMRQAMIYGTAGFTAGQCLDELLRHGVTPDDGPIVVSGATGGVGTFAVKILSQLGYTVVATTGKTEQREWLVAQGANEVLGRSDVSDESERPLLASRWAGAVDTVGGNTLATILRSTKSHGCVTACGMVGGVELPLTVFPFILRGVTLRGIDSAGITREYRQSIWDRLATDWSCSGLDQMTTECTFESLGPHIDSILSGQVVGRVIVKIAE